MIDALIEEAGLEVSACGYPLTDRWVRWHPRVRVMGPLAELELGPSARNISGARRAAERIVTSLVHDEVRLRRACRSRASLRVVLAAQPPTRTSEDSLPERSPRPRPCAILARFVVDLALLCESTPTPQTVPGSRRRQRSRIVMFIDIRRSDKYDDRQTALDCLSQVQIAPSF